MNYIRLRRLECRIDLTGRHVHIIARVRPGPTRVPVTLHNNVPRKENDRRFNGLYKLARIRLRTNPLIGGTFLHNDNVVARDNTGKTINRLK